MGNLRADMARAIMRRESKRIRVVIVDDHDMLREGLAVFLKAFRDMQLVGEAASGEDAVRLCTRLAPDVVLMDIVMSGMGGVEATRLIHEKRPGVRIIALSSFEDEQLVKSAIRAGATSYLLKNISADRLAEAIRSSLAGLPTFAPEIAPALVEERPPALSPIQHGLTHREREVLALLASGLSNSQISRRLNISLNTAKNHVGNILSKLGARNRTEAAGFVLQQAPAQPGKPMHSG
jgi:NarL family two-component system response regulator LiaR